MDGARRAMRATYQREMDDLESHLSFLASVGLGEPVRRPVRHGVGHHARLPRAANVAQATLAQVAPGIAEALIATAMGLFAAIPAVIAYNRFATTSTASRPASRASWRSSRTSCSARPADVMIERRAGRAR